MISLATTCYHESTKSHHEMKIPERDVTYIIISVYTIDIPLNLNLTLQNIDLYSTPMCGLWIFAGPLYTIYRVTSYLRLFALSILTHSANMTFLASLA